ncbi:hypothetical protein OV203_49805 [Nannocystis sp. ILAH1]|uniref:hypothetical protein n=1 Tax=unclassified Nannocystis TaxID=2627009 RepID=UPI0022722240|nr:MULTISPECIES: hypothetical protein [unclassified Nannocystis]MCY0995321.1 hypothetical protein [Nannocystis sp. ILAH1]MCY1065147.1 hypothetical protein [Nannocystis sp. RBIL2]
MVEETSHASASAASHSFVTSAARDSPAGTVDQPTAVYLKTLRQGGRIGPQRRPAYQLASLTAKHDYPSVDAGAKAVREHCIGRKANQSGKSATTMPEIIALQGTR